MVLGGAMASREREKERERERERASYSPRHIHLPPHLKLIQAPNGFEPHMFVRFFVCLCVLFFFPLFRLATRNGSSHCIGPKKKCHLIGKKFLKSFWDDLSS